MAIPTVVGVGTAANATKGSATPGLPTGWAAGDLLLVFIEAANEPINAMTGWADVGVGVVAQATGLVTSLTVRWKIAAAGEVAPAIAAGGTNDHVMARIAALRGVNATTPINITASGVDNTTGTAFSIPGATTTVADCLVIAALATGTDVNSTAMTTGWTNASLASPAITEQADNWTLSGNGGGIAVATGGKATAGAYNATTGTLTTGNTKALMSFAVAPAAAVTSFTRAAALTGSGSLTATQTPSTTRPADLSGSGTLAGAQTPAAAQPAAFTGSGSLTATAVVTVAAGFTGSGSLASTQAIAASQPAALTGSGTLTSTQAPATTRPASLAGTGTATAAQIPAVAQPAAAQGR
jgi:hypothetical protein